ncbi:MAG TPA: cohesin domain-containing protein [bacterium]|mgnify:CR=1 FL=1|nr:cohesin domain-containing protein [bacterium]HPG45251.1 cohesin domain-containing protein [bacterium]HPM99030.1 cohesin domain-containing protein [bacterium]
MKIKFGWWILFIFFGLLHSFSYSATLLIPERQGPPGSFVRVDIAVEGADSLAGMAAVLEYDLNFLEFVRVESEVQVHDFLVVSKENENQIAIAMAQPQPVGQPYAVICALTFRIRQSVETGTATELTWRSSQLYSVTTASIAHEVLHGVVRVRDISCYPNPFTPDGNGINDVVVFSLPEEMMPAAVVKIFALGGYLIRELKANGGSFIQWDGRDGDGDICKPGVYLYLVLMNDEPLHKGTITLML